MSHLNQLTACAILITRPEHQAEGLRQKIIQLGGLPILCPTIAITPPDNIHELSQIIQQLDHYDIAIFVSANAVWCSIKIIRKYWLSLPKHLIIMAIGNATANVLKEANIIVHHIPKNHFTSEELLSLEPLQQIAYKKIVLFAGKDGRDLIQTTLTRRKATVTKAIAYQRICPDMPANVQGFIQKKTLDYIISTSNEGLHNLIAMVDKARQARIIATPLVVVSERMALDAHALGFTAIMIAKNASDEAILATLIRWKETCDGREKS
jgi:uroporphyrinogen-III synthase